MSQLELFAEKIARIQNFGESKAYTRGELRDIALRMGLSEEDWTGIIEEVNGHRTRGQGFLKYGNWPDAVKELNQAAILDPHEPELLIELAMAHAGRYRAEGNPADKNQALAWADRCLALAPAHEGAVRLISEMRQDLRFSVRKVIFAAAALLLLALLIILGGGWLGWRSFKSKPVAVTPSPVEQKPAVRLPLATKPKGRLIEKVNDFDATPLGVPVRIVSNEASSVWNIEVFNSDFAPGPNGWSYKIHGFAGCQMEVRQATLKYEIIDRTGHIQVTERKLIQEEQHPVARGGDPFSIDHTVQVFSKAVPELDEVQLSVESFRGYPAPSTYQPSPVAPLIWPNRPERQNLEIRERLVNISQGYQSDSTKLKHELVLEVRNPGEVSLEWVKLGVVYYDKAGRERYRTEILPVSGRQPRYQMMMVWIARVLTGLPDMTAEEYGRYELSVIEAR